AEMVFARYWGAGRRLGTAARAAGSPLVAHQGLFGIASVVMLAFVLLLPTQALANGNELIFALDDPSRIARLAVTINKSETIRFKQSFAKALVASPEYADIAPLTDRSLYIIGKKVGQTRVTVLDDHERLLSVIDVEIGFDVPGLRKALRESLPNSHVHVT